VEDDKLMPEYLLVSGGECCSMEAVQAVQKHLEQLVAATRALARRHWQQALRIREKLRFSEEAFHLLLAARWGSSAASSTWSSIIASIGRRNFFSTARGTSR